MRIEFVEMIIDQLTDKGAMDSQPIRGSNHRGCAQRPEYFFDMKRADKLANTIDEINRSGAAV